MKFNIKNLKRITTELLEKHKRDSVDLFRDKVLLSNEKYEKLFGTPFIKGEKAAPWKRGILVIKNGKYKISRMFYGGNSLGVSKEKFGLTTGSINQLNISDKDIKNDSSCITIEPAKPFIGKFIFYWEHPVDSVRIAFKGAFYYCLIGLSVTIFFGLLVFF